MDNVSDSASEFGKDNGIVHEAVVTGRKVGAGREFWSRLAHDQDIFAQFVAVIEGKAQIVSDALKLIHRTENGCLKFVKEVKLPVAVIKQVKNIFIGERYFHRDQKIDHCFGPIVFGGTGGRSSVWNIESGYMTFVEIACKVLGILVGDHRTLMRALIEGGHTVTLAQVELFIFNEKSASYGSPGSRGDGLRTDNWGNFFFLEGDDGEVHVVRVRWCQGRTWSVHLYPLSTTESQNRGWFFFRS